MIRLGFWRVTLPNRLKGHLLEFSESDSALPSSLAAPSAQESCAPGGDVTVFPSKV